MNKQDNVAAPDKVRALGWVDDHVSLLDQRLLPRREEYLQIRTSDDMVNAIRDMVVRGAPAIGIAAAFGVVLAAREARQAGGENWKEVITDKLRRIGAARPTAVNLHWAIERMRRRIERCGPDPVPDLLEEARAIHVEDIAANRRMGDLGAEFLKEAGAVLTHCNTGSLATGGYGTALGVIRSAYARGHVKAVYASETRPWLQGSRLTVWELRQDGIPATLVADSAGAHLMKAGKVSWVIVGADRIAANGDVANKIGTYSHAVNARHHGIGFMVAAPTSTIDPATAGGEEIEIEQRHGGELLTVAGQNIAPEDTTAYNPVFDVTPASLIDVLVTEKGAVERPDREKIAALLAK